MFYFTCNESKIYESFTFWNKLQEKITFSRHSNLLRCTCIDSHVFISHVESMKAVKSSVYSAAAIGISWVSSSGCIWTFCARAPSGLRMKIYCWSQNRASLKDAHDNCSFCLIAISISLRFIVQPNDQTDQQFEQIIWMNDSMTNSLR